MNHPKYLLILTILASALAGCDSSQSGTASTAEDAHEHADAHAHASGGPHGGSMLELGEYHAELVHDDAAGTVTVYILDGAAAKNVPVDATEATVNLTHDGQGEQFKLAASPLDGEAAGWSSRFVSSDSHLAEDLDHAEAAAFVVTINGKQHRAAIEHQHEDGEDQAHDHDHAQE